MIKFNVPASLMRYQRVDDILRQDPVFNPYTQHRVVTVTGRLGRSDRFSVLTQLVTLTMCQSGVDTHSCNRSWVLATAHDLVKKVKLDKALRRAKVLILNQVIKAMRKERAQINARINKRLKELEEERRQVLNDT